MFRAYRIPELLQLATVHHRERTLFN